MSSTAVNPGVSDLLQTLSTLNSPVLSSPKVVTALENAPAADIVKLSTEATQLENVETMFGMTSANSSSRTAKCRPCWAMEAPATPPDLCSI